MRSSTEKSHIPHNYNRNLFNGVKIQHKFNQIKYKNKPLYYPSPNLHHSCQHPIHSFSLFIFIIFTLYIYIKLKHLNV